MKGEEDEKRRRRRRRRRRRKLKLKVEDVMDRAWHWNFSSSTALQLTAIYQDTAENTAERILKEERIDHYRKGAKRKNISLIFHYWHHSIVAALHHHTDKYSPKYYHSSTSHKRGILKNFPYTFIQRDHTE